MERVYTQIYFWRMMEEFQQYLNMELK